jgi:hypothetical protein
MIHLPPSCSAAVLAVGICHGLFVSPLGAQFNSTNIGGYENVLGAGAANAANLAGAANTNNSVNGAIAGAANSSLSDLWVGFIGGSYLGNIGTGSHVSAILGGHANTISANSSRAAILGGYANTVSAEMATVVGGALNNNRAINGAIAGSSDSSMADLWVGFIGGSYLGNIGTGSHVSAILGGHANTISANSWRAVVLGGFSNTVSSVSAMVGGGENNMVSPNAFASFIGGGTYNTTMAQGASVIGGFANEASGTNSFAAGFQAVAGHAGTFVWSDMSTANEFASTANNQFLIRAIGGVGINTNNPGTNALLVNGSLRVTGSLQASSLAAGTVTPQAMAAGTLSSWSVMADTSTLAQPNTKHLMPEGGAGVLRTPQSPSPGTTIVAAGQGRINVGATEWVTGSWYSPAVNLRADQLFVSGDGNIIAAYSQQDSRFTVLNINADTQTFIPSPISTNAFTNMPPYNMYTYPGYSIGESNSHLLAMSGDGAKFLGVFGGIGSQKLYLRLQSAESWDDITPFPSLDTFQALAASDDFSVIYAVAQSGGMYASNAPGLIRSDNGGQAWQTRTLPGGTNGSTVQQMAASSDGSIIFVLYGPGYMMMPSSSSSELWRSTNRGTNWTKLNLGDVQIASPPSFSVSGDAQKLAVKTATPEPGYMDMTNWIPALSVSTNGGNTWTTHPQPSMSIYASSTMPMGSPTVDYLLSRLGNVLIYRKWGPVDYMQTGSMVEFATSSDMGVTWRSSYMGTSWQTAAPALATDSTGTQIAAANWQSSMNNSDAVDGIYLSAARSVQIYGDGQAELIHRGGGKWNLLSGGYATGFFAPQPAASD